MFTTIVVTPPRFVKGEAQRIESLLLEGTADFVHLRKPEASREELEALLTAIPEDLHPRLTLHDHFSLCSRYNVGGVHTNRRYPDPPADFQGRISHSCHTPEEVEAYKPLRDFVSLSPVFYSVSKPGYRTPISPATVYWLRHQRIIDGKVYALGGVTFRLLPTVFAMGFGGAMILGDAWRDCL